MRRGSIKIWAELMSKLSITELYDHLVTKLGKETTEKLILFIGTDMNEKIETIMKAFATKEDLARFTLASKEDFTRFALATKEDFNRFTLAAKEDFTRFTLATKEDFTSFTLATKEDFTSFTLAAKEDITRFTLATRDELARFTLATKEELVKLDSKINQTKIDIIKWMFGFWITVILMFLGLYFKS